MYFILHFNTSFFWFSFCEALSIDYIMFSINSIFSLDSNSKDCLPFKNLTYECILGHSSFFSLINWVIHPLNQFYSIILFLNCQTNFIVIIDNEKILWFWQLKTTLLYQKSYILNMAGVAGVEPTWTVLETVILPLNYTPKQM